VLVGEQLGHVLPEQVGRDFLLPRVAGQSDLEVEAVQRGGAEGQGEDVVVLVGEVAGMAPRVVGVQLVDVRDGLPGPGMAGPVEPPEEVVADGVLDALRGALDDFAVTVVPQRARAVRRQVEVRE
jgi:hypothetical protein